MSETFKIKSESILTLKFGDDGRTKLVSSSVYLSVDIRLDPAPYFQDNQELSHEGYKAITNGFIQGLHGSILGANKLGSWNEIEHLEFIIAELKRAVFTPADIDTRAQRES